MTEPHESAVRDEAAETIAMSRDLRQLMADAVAKLEVLLPALEQELEHYRRIRSCTHD
jgi:hypothetical protein